MAATTSAAAAQPELTPAERDAAIARLNTLLADEYVDPASAKRMRQALQQHQRQGDYAKLSEGQAFADRLTADLRAIGHDKHLWIGFRPDGARDEPADGPSPAELEQWRPAIARDNFAFDKVERLPGNIGYLKFRIFAYPYLAEDTASAAMSFLAHADALIIDLRENMGGDPEMVAFLASYLFDRPVQLNDIRYHRGGKVRQYWTLPQVPGARYGGTKPVYVLTSPVTFSAAKDFTYALQTRSRATVVGERSGGGARPAREYALGERFTASIPYAQSISPLTGKNWEGEGITPDVPVAQARALDTAYRLALARLVKDSATPGQAQEWQQLLDALPAQ
ncbi:MAG TPA: S41 family peptidase [Stenotrophomonas sp.]|nr:S41 family peptidase [Stenotrophomonas sp.]